MGRNIKMSIDKDKINEVEVARVTAMKNKTMTKKAKKVSVLGIFRDMPSFKDYLPSFNINKQNVDTAIPILVLFFGTAYCFILYFYPALGQKLKDMVERIALVFR